MGYIGAGISRFNTVNGLSVNADGPTVTGIKDEDNMASDSAVKLATQQSIKAYVDSQIGANNELSEVLANGSTTGGNDISFGDADRAYFGAGNDLEIFSDGNTSYIKENGSGDLRIWADNPNIATAGGNKIFYGNNGVAELYYTGGVKRLETTSGGISVTGVVAATSYTGDGSSLTGINTDLVSDTTPQLGGNLDLNNSDVTGTGDINITGTLTSTALDLNGNGDVSGNLVVNGLLMAVNGVARTTANTQDALVFTTGEGLMKLNARGSIRYDIDNNANGTGQYHEFTTNDGGASLLKMQDSTGTVFNETGQDLDFRVESNNNNSMLFVDGGADRLGVGLSSPTQFVDIAGDVWVRGDSSDYNATISLGKFEDTTNPLIDLTTDDVSADKFSIHNRRWSHSVAFSRSSPAGGPVETFLVEGSSSTSLKLYHQTDPSTSTATVERVRLTTDGNSYITQGNFGLGTSSPSEVLTVAASSSNARISITDTDSTKATMIGLVEFDGTDGRNGYVGPVDGNMTINTDGGYPIKFQTSGTERMRIDASGNVKIDDGAELRIHRPGAGYANAYAGISMNTGETIIYKNSWGNKDFRFTRAGEFLLNTTSPLYSSILSVNGKAVVRDGVGDGALKVIGAGGTYGGGEVLQVGSEGTSAFNAVKFRTDTDGTNTQVGLISCSTSGTTYSTTSDIRLKTDIAPIADATDKLMAMNAVTHRWRAEPDADAVHGFIAQEMAEIVPEAVSGDPDGEEMMAMDYGRITPVIVAALQEANKKIAELETRIKELETK